MRTWSFAVSRVAVRPNTASGLTEVTTSMLRLLTATCTSSMTRTSTRPNHLANSFRLRARASVCTVATVMRRGSNLPPPTTPTFSPRYASNSCLLCSNKVNSSHTKTALPTSFLKYIAVVHVLPSPVAISTTPPTRLAFTIASTQSTWNVLLLSSLMSRNFGMVRLSSTFSVYATLSPASCSRNRPDATRPLWRQLWKPSHAPSA